MSLDLTKGMECPVCGVKKGFSGGHFGVPIIATNFSCKCGFRAIILIPPEDREIEYRLAPKQE